MSQTDPLQEFQIAVDSYVSDSLSTYNPEKHAKEKSIRDALWGTSRFSPWEVAILDSPLLQRLRDIRQTGLAYLVYPTALHNRFDHTLGVVTVASRIVRSINDKHPPGDPKIQYGDHMRIRLSALLHDVGHSSLSHVSETIYGASEAFAGLLRRVNENLGVTPKPHEVMSWLVVRSSPFASFMERLKSKGILTGWDFTTADMEAIAGNIIGYRKDPAQKFQADIVNGPMDADKLDYLARDAYFAGPTVVYDLERFLHTVDAIEYPHEQAGGGMDGKIVRLSIPIQGATALEQIIISKLMLYSYLYHHQKIRCVEGMYHEVLKRCVPAPGQKGKRPKGKRSRLPFLDHPVSFLKASDRSFLPDAWPPEVEGDKVAGEIISMLTRRELYKRALIISRLFISGVDTDERVRSGFEKLLECGGDTSARDSLRQAIVDQSKKLMTTKPFKDEMKELRAKLEIRHVLLDIPGSPTVEETDGVMIHVGAEAGADHHGWVPLIDIFPIEKWVDAYNAIKWRAHIFTLEEATRFVNYATLKVLASEPYFLQFTGQATDLCKIANPIPFSTAKPLF